MTENTQEPHAELLRRIDPQARLSSQRELAGGLSAHTMVLEWLDGSGALRSAVLRRLELRWLLGEPAMQQLTQTYCETLPCHPSQLPYWDLLAALRPGSRLSIWAEAWPDCARPEVTLESMQHALDSFIAQALAAVG